jgi:hypothetical protein
MMRRVDHAAPELIETGGGFGVIRWLGKYAVTFEPRARAIIMGALPPAVIPTVQWTDRRTAEIRIEAMRWGHIGDTMAGQKTSVYLHPADKAVLKRHGRSVSEQASRDATVMSLLEAMEAGEFDGVLLADALKLARKTAETKLSQRGGDDVES